MKKFLKIVILAFLLSAFFSVTVFAEDCDALEETAFTAEVIPETESPEDPTIEVPDAQEPALEQVSEPEVEIVEEPAEEVPAVEEVIEPEAAEEEASSEVTESAPSASYLIKFINLADESGAEHAFAGGSETGIPVSDILASMGYTLTETTEIAVLDESVDTDVIGVREIDGRLYITDYGHFEKAAKNLVLTVDGEEVVLEVVDDNAFYVDADSGEDSDDRSGASELPFRTIGYAISKADTEATKITLKTNVRENITIEDTQTITLDLNGYVLSGDEKGSVITNNGTLTILDSNTEEQTHSFTPDDTGLWVLDEDGGSETLTGGCITGGAGSFNGFVYIGGGINNNGKLTFSKGNIVGNTADYGGGIVSLSETSEIFLNGGNVIGNTAVEEGGGVFLYHCGTSSLTMTGGSITDNTAGLAGGGLAVDADSTNSLDTKVTLGGTAKIYGNSADFGDNLIAFDLEEYVPLMVNVGTADAAPAEGMSVYVTVFGFADDNPFSDVGQFTMNGQESDCAYFTPDNADYEVAYNDAGYLQLKKTHIHGSWTYSADGEVLTATCGEEDCELKDSKVSITIEVYSKTYNGEKASAALTNADAWEDAGLTTPELCYFVMGKSAQLTDSPADAGAYTVKITVGDATASCDFTISPRQLTVEGTTADGKTYDGTTTAVAHLGTVKGKVVGDDVVVEIREALFSDKNAENGKNVTVSYALTGTKAANYAISNTQTSADIEKRGVTLTSGSSSKVYDGKPLTNGEVSVSGDGFVSGEGATFSVSGSQMKAGSSKNAFTYTLNNGTEASNYVITQKEGELTVSKVAREIVITADSMAKLYDGMALIASGYTFTDGVLVSGDVLSATVAGEILDAGATNNAVTSYKVMRGDVDVTDCYTFAASEDGVLKVLSRSVTLTSGSSTKVYDGKPLTNGEVSVSGDGFVSGEGAVYTVSGSQTEVGTSANSFSYELNSNTKPGNYLISKEEGTLTITAKPAPIPAPEGKITVEVPIENGNTVIVDALAAGNKVTLPELTSETIQSITSGKNATGKVTIDCANTGKTITQIEIKTENVESLAASPVQALTVNLNSGSISLNSEALQTVTGSALGDSLVLELKATGASTLSVTKQSAAIAELTSKEGAEILAVIDAFILSDKSKISNLGNGKAELAINPEIFSSENLELVKSGKIAIYEISEDGTTTAVAFEIVDGKIVLEVNSLAQYVVLAESEEEATELALVKEVPKCLEGSKYNTLEMLAELESEMTDALATEYKVEFNAELPSGNSKVYNIESLAANTENVGGSLIVNIPYPAGTEQDSNEYIAVQLQENDEIEEVDTFLTNKGIQIEVETLKPVGVAWKNK